MTDNNKIQASSVDNNKIQANLTEQWKKGELPEGLYWVKHDGVINILDDLEISLTNVEQILAQVPSYNELQNMNEAVNECMAANIKLVEENAQLKEQINKCCLDAINRGTANAVKAVKEFGMPERIEELVEENAQFKELLKEVFVAINEGSYFDQCDILKKIDEALK